MNTLHHIPTLAPAAHLALHSAVTYNTAQHNAAKDSSVPHCTTHESTPCQGILSRPNTTTGDDKNKAHQGAWTHLQPLLPSPIASQAPCITFGQARQSDLLTIEQHPNKIVLLWSCRLLFSVLVLGRVAPKLHDDMACVGWPQLQLVRRWELRSLTRAAYVHKRYVYLRRGCKAYGCKKRAYNDCRNGA